MQGLNNPIGIKSIEPNQNPFITNPYRFGGGGIGGWTELARTTLGSAGTNLDVTGFADKRYYMVLADHRNASNVYPFCRLGNATFDTGTSYGRRYSIDGGADSSATWTNMVLEGGSGALVGEGFNVSYFANKSDEEKLMISHEVIQNTAGSGTAPRRGETVGKWHNASNPMDRIRHYDANGSSMNTGAEMVVLGWDPADTHTTNFWEELASVDMSGGTGSTLTTGTFTAKKYLWIQVYVETEGGGAAMTGLEFNGDTANNYGMRTKTNGGSENISDVSIPDIYQFNNTTGKPIFANYFVINNSANEKLLIGQSVRQNTAGSANAPGRMESVAKWANTSAQITRIDLNIRSGYSGVLQTPTIMRVWGSN